MAVREFDGTDDRITVDNGAIGQIANGPLSIVMLGKPASLTSGEAFLGLGDGGDLASLNNGGGAIIGYGADHGDSIVSIGLTASAWQVFGWSKATGTVAIRGHRKVLGSGSWTHTNAAGTISNDTGTCTNVNFGRYASGVGFKDFRCAVAAVFDVELSDADWVGIESAASTAAIEALGPVAGWELNQDSTATNVTDWTGGGADQTDITGTTVIADGVDDPAWTFGLETVFAAGGGRAARPGRDRGRFPLRGPKWF